MSAVDDQIRRQRYRDEACARAKAAEFKDERLNEQCARLDREVNDDWAAWLRRYSR